MGKAMCAFSLVSVLAGFASGAAGEIFEDCLVREIMAGDGQRSADTIRSSCEDETRLDSRAIEPSRRHDTGLYLGYTGTSWWPGYGESLIDYDQTVNRFGTG